jgi:hypothetical protein
MYRQAIGESPAETHHTIWLTALWHYLLPVELGPIIPFILQQLVFWGSVGMISNLAYKSSPVIGIFLPIVVFLIEHTWVLGWIWKDAAALSTGVLSLSFLIHFLHKPSWRSLLLGLFFLGLTVSIRWYLVATAIILLITLILYAVKQLGTIRSLRPRSSNGSIILTFVAACTVFASGYFSPLVLPALAFDEVRDSHSISHTLLWDLVRLQCETVPPQSIVPPEFVYEPDADLCENYNALNMWSVRSKLILPSSPVQSIAVQNVWVAEAPKSIPILVENRILLAIYLLRPADGWVVPSYNLYGSGGGKPSLVVQERGGQEIGFDSSGLGFLKVSRLHTGLSSIGSQILSVFQSAYFWVLTLPFLLTLLNISNRKNLVFPLGLMLAMYSFPWFWVLGLGFVSPWSDTRYVAIAVLWTTIWSGFVIAKFIEKLRSKAPGV